MRRPKSQIQWSDPPVGDHANAKRAEKPLADLSAQAKTPEQKELLKQLEGSFAKTDKKEKAERHKANEIVPEGFEAQPDGSYLCVSCTEVEGSPFLVKRRQDITRHSVGSGHLHALDELDEPGEKQAG